MYLSTGTAIIKAFERLAARLGVEMDTVADFPYGLLAYTVCIAHYKMRIVDASKVCRRQANGTRAHGTRARHTRMAPQHAHGTHTAYTRHAHGTHTAHAHARVAHAYGTPARTARAHWRVNVLARTHARTHATQCPFLDRHPRPSRSTDCHTPRISERRWSKWSCSCRTPTRRGR